MGEVKLTMADREFLLRVERGEIRMTVGYTAKRGGYTIFHGGEKTFNRMRKTGLVAMLSVPSMGRPAIATLTDAGQAALKAYPPSPTTSAADAPTRRN